jgi:hypothetical protein
MSIIANVSGCTNIKNIICNDADDEINVMTVLF